MLSIPVIISICWVTGGIIGFLPLMGWHKDAPTDGKCFFLDVMDYNYLVFLYFGTIITPALLLAAFYAHIYQVVLKQLRQIVTMNPESGTSTTGCVSGGTMLRMLGAAQKREVKATQNLAIIVLFFMICWIPLYTVNCILAFCKTCVTTDSRFMFACIILSHLNSAGNPILYAYHLKDFRAALKVFLCGLIGYNEHQINAQNRTSLASNNNCNQYRMQPRNYVNSSTSIKLRNTSQIYYKKKPLEHSTVPKITTIVSNSVSLAIAAAGELNREIWNIPEVSSDSSDSLRNMNPSHHDKVSMVRPATPYRPRKTSNNSQVNQAYIETSSVEDENDDVFLDDTFPFTDFQYDSLEQETNLTEQIKRDIKVVPRVERSKSNSLSSSSPQISRSLFFVESDVVSKPQSKFIRSSSFLEQKRPLRLSSEDDDSDLHKETIHQLEVVEDIFKIKNKQLLGRSLSDEGRVPREFVSTKPNGTIIRNSCGN